MTFIPITQEDRKTSGVCDNSDRYGREGYREHSCIERLFHGIATGYGRMDVTFFSIVLGRLGRTLVSEALGTTVMARVSGGGLTQDPESVRVVEPVGATSATGSGRWRRAGAPGRI